MKIFSHLNRKILFLLSVFLVPLAGRADETEVKASSFGFDRENATECLQKAIASGAKKVVVDNTGSPWFIAPVKLRSDLELVFAAGVKVMALQGSYRGRWDSMFSGVDLDNVIVRGEAGAVLEMRKQDYQKKEDYAWSSWRHGLNFRGCHNVVIRDLTIRSSGGDGIYISNSPRRGPCRDVRIENVISDDHYRQGISVISAVNLLIRGCKFINTAGTAPQHGIDLEPNKSCDVLENNVIENCEFYGNASAGAAFFLPWLQAPVSITFRDCRMYGNMFGISTLAQSGPNGEKQQGQILFENCEVYGNKKNAVTMYGQQDDGLTVTLRNCIIDNREGSTAAFTFNNSRVSSNISGIIFENCILRPGKNRIFEIIQRSGYGVGRIAGDLRIERNEGERSLANWDDLRKEYPENKELQNFEIAEVAFEKLQSLKESVPGPDENYQSWRIRGRGTCLLYTEKPGTYEVRFSVDPLYLNRDIRYQVAVKTANNTLIEKFDITVPEYTRKFESRGKQLFVLEISNAAQTVAVHSPHPGFGFLVQDRLAFFRGDVKNMYFYVQPGVEKFKIEVQGEGREWVTARLNDPSGRTVASCEKKTGAVILVGTRTDASKGEVWNLQLLGMEDHSLRFAAPLIPVVSPRKDQVLVYEENK